MKTPLLVLPILLFFLMLASAHSFFQGSISPIPKSLQKEMIGHTWHTGCPVSLNELSLLKMTYWGFDNQSHQGEMIVHQQFSREVLDIFKQLYASHVEIEKMVIPEKLTAHQSFSNPMDLLMYLVNSDDTYGFFCRIDTQTNRKLSAHSFGIAMDINPFYNPSVILHPKENQAVRDDQQEGIKYLNRELNHVGMIKENDVTFKIFTQHGWKWGGFFSEGVDYMHFQKVISPYYIVDQLSYVPPKERMMHLDEMS